MPTDFSEEFFEFTVRQFLKECTIRAEGQSIKTSVLKNHYDAWALERGYGASDSKKFVGVLRGVLTVKKIAEGNVARDVSLKN